MVYFLLGLGVGTGLFASNALLISREGPQSLLFIYFFAALFSLLAVGTFFLTSDRGSRKKLMLVSYPLLSLAILVLWAVLQAHPDIRWIYFFMRVFFFGVLVLTTMEFWTLAADAFNNLEARRRFPLLVASGVLGRVCGGLLTSLLAVPWGTQNLILIWSWVLLLCPFLLIRIPESSHPSEPSGSHGHDALTGGWPRTPRVAYPGTFVVAIFAFWAAYSFFAYGTDFLFNSFAARIYADPDTLAAFYGKVTLYANLAVFAYQIFVAGPLALRLGVDRLITSIPWLFALAAGALYFAPGLLTAAAAESLAFLFIDFAAAALLQPTLNLFPMQERGKIKVFTEGLGRPFGILFFLGVVFLGSWIWPDFQLALVLFVASLIFLFYPFYFNWSYLRHLRAILHCPEYPLVANAIQALGEPNKKKAVPELCDLLKNSTRLDLQKTIVLSLGKIRSREAFADIVRAFHVKNEALQLAVLESLGNYRNYEGIYALFRLLKSGENVSFQVRMNATQILTRLIGKQMIPFLMEGLDDPDPRVQANAIESIGTLRDRKTLPLLIPFLQHRSNRVRANAAIVLYSFRKTRALATRTVESMFRSTDPLAKSSALYAIGELRLKENEPELIRLLHAKDKRVVEHASVALAKMKNPVFTETFLALLTGDDERVSRHLLRHLAHFPPASRFLLFERISEETAKTQAAILHQLDQAPLDFSLEKTLLYEQNSQNPEFQRHAEALETSQRPT